MGDLQANRIGAQPLQYATPRAAALRGWMVCIVGLFAWGTLVLLLIPLIAAVRICDKASAEDIAFTLIGATCIILPLGLPPLITARNLIRGELRLIGITIIVMEAPMPVAIAISALGLARAVAALPEEGWVAALFFAGCITLFGAVFWLGFKLEGITSAMDRADLKRQMEGTHGES